MTLTKKKPYKKPILGGHSLSEVARGTGLSVSHLSRIFSGERSPSLDAARRISKYLRVSLDRLAKVV